MKRPPRFGDADTHGRILVLAKRPRYLVVTKDAMEDNRLSLRARGLLAYLLCKPPDWVVNVVAIVKHLAGTDNGEGRNAVRTALKELEEVGYFRRVRRRNIHGHFFWITVVFEWPQIFEERYRQGELFEEFMQEVVPGSVPADDAPPRLFSEGPDQRPDSGAWTKGKEGGGVDVAGHGHKTSDPTMRRKTADGEPGAGRPSAADRTLLNTEVVSHHQTKDRVTKKPARARVDAASLQAGSNGAEPEPEGPEEVRTDPFGDDEQERVRERDWVLPASADLWDVKRFLIERCGIGTGRAHNLANHPFATIELLNTILAKAEDYRPGMDNKGAYVATLINEALESAKREEINRQRAVAKSAVSQREQIDASIDAMPDAELAEWMSKRSMLKDMTPEQVRGDGAFRREVVDVILKSERSKAA